MKINKPIHTWQLKFEGEWPTSVAFLGNGNRIAAGNRSGQIFVWDLPDAPPEPTDDEKDKKNEKDKSPPNQPPSRRLDGHTNGISHLRASADGKLLVSSSFDRTIRLWDVDAPASGKAEVVLDAKERTSKVRYKSGEEKDAILNAPGHMIETVAATHTLEGHKDWVASLALGSDEKRIISGDNSSLVIAWDVETRKEISRWSGHQWNGVVAAALSPDGQTALVSEYRYKRDDFDIPAAALKLWNVSDGKERLDLLKLQFPKLDVTASTYGSAQMWRKFVKGGLLAAEFSPDGKLIAVGQGGETDTGKVHLFDSESGKLLRTVSGHRYGVCDVKFSADSKYILSSGRDTMVRICQCADGKEIATLGKERGGQFKDWLHAIAISPDQKTAAAADIAGMIHVWQLQS
jgi:WD40 repeat protein